MSLALSQPKLNPPASPPFCAGRKLRDVEKVLIWQALHDNPQCPSRLVLNQVTQNHAPLDMAQ
jgi:hypothetical protein